MIRRFALAALAAAAAWPAAAQLGDLARPGVADGRPGVDEALRRTIQLVLRAEARRAALPDFLSDPQPLAAEDAALLRVGARLSPEFPATLLSERVNRRLPHARGGSVWVAAGAALAEIDPVRLRVLTVAPDALPPDLEPDR